MDTKKRRLLRFAYFISLVVISLVVIGFFLKFLGRPIPINKNNLPYEFLVVGRASSDDLFALLTLYEYSKGVQDQCTRAGKNEDEIKRNRDNLLWSNGKIIWSEEMQKYEYYIRKTDLTSIVESLKKRFARGSDTDIGISILNDDSSIKKQTICLTYAPESIHHFVYQVENRKVKPLRYGDFTKQDAMLAVLAGSLVFAAGFALFKKIKHK